MNVDGVLAHAGESLILHEARNRVAEVPVRPMRQRVDALDYVKGTLVVLMVVYHWMNYFVDVKWDVYRYLRFLTPSFIFITGFIVSHVHATSRSADLRRVSLRLWQRGAKLLILFTCLNVAANLLLSRNYDGNPLSVAAFVHQAYAVYVTGNGRAVFDVLVPIAYFLLLAPIVLTVACRFALALPLVTGAGLAIAWVASVRGASSVNLELLSIALLGMLIGTVPLERVTRIGSWPVLGVYVVYLGAITVWNVIFPLQVMGVCLTLLIMYFLALGVGSDGWSQRILIRLGQYSLFGYIVQVVLLQFLRRGLSAMNLHGAELFVPFALALVLTVMSVLVLHQVRQSVAAIDRLYRIVFA